MPEESDRIRGRGATSNRQGRFEPFEIHLDAEAEFESRGRLRTRFYDDLSESIVTYNSSPDIPFNASVNPYRGCEHGCAYCYARPTHEYLGFSAGLDFESKILVKRQAPELLKKALSSPSWQPQWVAMSGVTDPYQPIERTLGLTRSCLEVLSDFRNPVGIVTKNRLVTRDVELLASMAEQNLSMVSVSLTTLNAELARVMEPRTSSPSARLEAVRALSALKVPVGIMIAPVIPGLNDHEIPALLRAAREAGARFATYVLLRLPYGVKDIFFEWLSAAYPNAKDKVESRLRDIRGGELNRSAFGERFKGRGLFAEQIRQLFAVSLKREKLENEPPRLSVERFRRPQSPQLEWDF